MAENNDATVSQFKNGAVHMSRIPEIEGLRGFLCLWVFGSHLMWASGFSRDQAPSVLGLLFSGPAAVEVFMCISGFVIFFLCDARPESYPVYLVRRFFRIWPLFAVTTLIGILLFCFHWGDPSQGYNGPVVCIRGEAYY